MLLDTSGLLALLSDTESYHELALTLFGGAGFSLTHSYVLAELVALGQSRGVSRTLVLALASRLVDSPEVEVVWVDEALHREAMTLLAARADKTYSLCDAVSFVLMRRRGLFEALTTDRHFEQEGFRRLLA